MRRGPGGRSRRNLVSRLPASPARRQPLRAFLQVADRSGVWPAIAGGCHPARDTATAIEAGGFQIERCERFAFRACAIEPSVPHILGVARRVER
jgi:hypothetical protein